MEGSRAVAEESRMDVVGEERDESGSSDAQSIRRRIMTNTSMEESRMDDGRRRETNSEVPNIRQRIATKNTVGRNEK